MLLLLSFQGLENRLKYSMVDLESSKKSIQQYDNQLQQVQSELDEFGVSLEKGQQTNNKNAFLLFFLYEFVFVFNFFFVNF